MIFDLWKGVFVLYYYILLMLEETFTATILRCCCSENKKCLLAAREPSLLAGAAAGRLTSFVLVACCFVPFSSRSCPVSHRFPNNTTHRETKEVSLRETHRATNFLSTSNFDCRSNCII